MTLGAVAYSPDPAPPYDLVLTPVVPMSMVYIVVLTMFEEDTTLGYTTLHGQYFDPKLRHWSRRSSQSVDLHPPI